MSAAQWIQLAIQGSLLLVVFSIALHASLDDLLYLARKPGLLLRSLLAMNVLMPCVAIALTMAFDLPTPLRVALLGLALAPVPPILPNREVKAGGERSYGVALLATAALVAIVFVPLGAELVGRLFGRDVNVPPATIAKIMAVSVLLPVLAGVCVRRFAPAFAARIAQPLAGFGMALLLLAALPILLMEWRAVLTLVGDFSVVVIAIFVLAGLAIGHALGGPDPDNRTVLALSTGNRHPAVALAIGAGLADKPTLLAAVLLAFLVGFVVSTPYVMWRMRSNAAGHAQRPATRP